MTNVQSATYSRRKIFVQVITYAKHVIQSTGLICHLNTVNFYLLQPLDIEVKALIYAVAVCYHARLSNRLKFEEGIAQKFPHDFCYIDAGRFRKEIER